MIYSNATFPGSNPDDFRDPLSSVTNNYNASFRLTFNLFNGGRINRAISNAIIQEDIGNIQVDQLKNSLRNDLSAAFDNYGIRQKLHGISVRQKEVAALNLRLSREKFRSGTINSFDYRTIQNNYQLAAIQELQALYNLMDADVNLMKLTGGILEVYK